MFKEAAESTNEKEVMEKAIYYFGKTVQKVIAIEELSELQKAISKSIRYDEMGATDPNRGESIREDIIEEIADVGICIKQIMTMLDIDEKEIDKVTKVKIERLNSKVNVLITAAKVANHLYLP